MTGPVVALGLFLLVIAVCVVYGYGESVGRKHENEEWRLNASTLGFSEFNRKTGEWQWNMDVIDAARMMREREREREREQGGGREARKDG